MGSVPVALFVNCIFDETKDTLVAPLSLLKVILSDITYFETRWTNTKSFKWKLCNKYYTANIDLVAITSPLMPGDHNPTLNEGLSSRTEAIVFSFESNAPASFNLVKHWIPFIERFSPTVRLLVCQNCQDDHFPNRTEVITWCIENQFELVELDDDDVDDDDEKESNIGKLFGSGEFGVPRIVAALQAHMWSNMELIPNQGQAAGGLKTSESSSIQL